MRSRPCVRTAALLGLVLAGGLIVTTDPAGRPGIAAAEGAEYYTRKRVNGTWITGRFPKDEPAAASASSDPTARPRTRAAEKTPDSGGVPLPPAAPASAARAAAYAARAAGEPAGSALVETTASLPAAAIEDRMARLRDALQARASEIAASVTASLPASLQMQPAPDTPPQQSAADAAKPTAPAELAPQAGTPRSAAARNPLEPRSISYDFETGVKTTVFENSVVREPFDVASVRAMTRLSTR